MPPYVPYKRDDGVSPITDAAILKTMSAEGINKALLDGRLDGLLNIPRPPRIVVGLDPDEVQAAIDAGELDEFLVAHEAKQAAAETKTPPGDADQGARGTLVVGTREWLEKASAEEINVALKEGRLDDLLDGSRSA